VIERGNRFLWPGVLRASALMTSHGDQMKCPKCGEKVEDERATIKKVVKPFSNSCHVVLPKNHFPAGSRVLIKKLD